MSQQTEEGKLIQPVSSLSIIDSVMSEIMSDPLSPSHIAFHIVSTQIFLD